MFGTFGLIRNPRGPSSHGHTRSNSCLTAQYLHTMITSSWADITNWNNAIDQKNKEKRYEKARRREEFVNKFSQGVIIK